MSRLTRDRIAEPVSRGQILRRVRGQGNIHFPSTMFFVLCRLSITAFRQRHGTIRCYDASLVIRRNSWSAVGLWFSPSLRDLTESSSSPTAFVFVIDLMVENASFAVG